MAILDSSYIGNHVTKIVYFEDISVRGSLIFRLAKIATADALVLVTANTAQHTAHDSSSCRVELPHHRSHGFPCGQVFGY